MKIRFALFGGFVVVLLFEILKKLFGYYVTTLPTHEVAYSALATLPTF